MENEGKIEGKITPVLGDKVRLTGGVPHTHLMPDFINRRLNPHTMSMEEKIDHIKYKYNLSHGPGKRKKKKKK